MLLSSFDFATHFISLFQVFLTTCYKDYRVRQRDSLSLQMEKERHENG
jgi:hypothetical protein